MRTGGEWAPASGKDSLSMRFDRVAARYDRLNALNPGYTKHLRWSAERLALPEDARVLDLCCGTGLSTSALRRAYPRARITALDASAGMLNVARRKPELGGVTWLLGDAMDPASAGAEGPYDGILMAYGIRNVVDPDACLRRLRDLLASGGALCLHEYSVAGSRRARTVWKLVTSLVIIPAGFVLTGSTALFRYLRRSVLEFDDVSSLQDRLRRAGFVDVRTEAMDGWQRDIVHSFMAWQPE